MNVPNQTLRLGDQSLEIGGLFFVFQLGYVKNQRFGMSPVVKHMQREVDKVQAVDVFADTKLAVRMVPESEGCSREGASGQDLQVIFVEYVEGRLTVVFKTSTFVGSWLVCAAGDAVAIVTVVAPAGTDQSQDLTGPCDFAVCDEVDETCQLSAMQFCLESEDARCDALLYRFQRTAREEVRLIPTENFPARGTAEIMQ